MGNQFVRYQLRTSDVDTAREFYRALFGDAFWSGPIDVSSLPAQAVSRGAPPHWLGHIGVDDVDGLVNRFVEEGATQLGPGRAAARESSRTTQSAIVRDPFGAIVALTDDQSPFTGHCVAWHVLHTRDETRAFSLYAKLFGWTPLEAIDLGSERGRHQTFAWTPSGPAVGSTSDSGRLPHVHPQWLFFFETKNIDASLALVRSLGGLTLRPMRTANGDVAAPCDDPQGAAFALYEVRSVLF